MTKHVTHGLLALLVALTTSCTGSVAVEHENHEFEDGVDIDLGTDPWRARRRMDLDQLDASIRRATGGIGWDRYGGTPRTLRENYFERYEDTLGVPDYINSSAEDLSASLLFAKFLDDAGRAVCRRAVNRETERGGEEQDGAAIGLFAPVDVEDPEPAAADVSETLANLLLRFHGRSLEPDDPQLTPWREFYGSVAATANAAEDPEPQRAWEAVCVALVTHPDFYTY